RHRPNKVVAEQDSSDSESSDQEVTQPTKPPPKVSSAGGITSNLSKVDLNERRRIAAEKEKARIEEERALKAKAEEGFETASEEESEDGSGSEGEQRRGIKRRRGSQEVMLRPTFIKKDKRNNPAATKDTKTDEASAAAEEARKKELANEIVEEQIKKDIAARAAGKKNWMTTKMRTRLPKLSTLWKLREIRRTKRERELIEEHEKEKAEVERRRNLTEEERKAEDDEYIARQKEEKESRGRAGYMQKYYHKGAFFRDEAEAQGLDRRDLMGATYADDVQNRELLPQALQMRDMTKIGKKGATKYKDLRSEDTGQRFGGYNQDDRFRPDRDRDREAAVERRRVG
ncbi:splicing factor, Prp19-binding domain-containing protein, partial [Bisporella sp. PMI_857]